MLFGMVVARRRDPFVAFSHSILPCAFHLHRDGPNNSPCRYQYDFFHYSHPLITHLTCFATHPHPLKHQNAKANLEPLPIPNAQQQTARLSSFICAQIQRHTTPPSGTIPLRAITKLPRARKLRFILKSPSEILHNPNTPASLAAPTFRRRALHAGSAIRQSI